MRRKENTMYKTSISDEELQQVNFIIDEIVSSYISVEDVDFLQNAAVYAHELPRRLRSFLNDFKTLEPQPAFCLISDYRIDGERIGSTPTHWQLKQPVSPTIREEVLLILLGSLLGEVFGWSTQQNGYIIHDVLPIREHAAEQLGTGSEQLLWWHNEDAFHPYRGDYLAMMCLRNPDRVATMVAGLDISGLDERYIEILFQPRFSIRPDESHQEKNKAAAQTGPLAEDSTLESAYQRIKKMQDEPQRIPVLFGDRQSPYVRIDPYFMDSPADDEEGRAALNGLIRIIEGNLVDLVLAPGDIVFIDNFRAVHGRRPFHARYDGLDRWLKRINITRDLRKSRTLRTATASRILY
jgi:Fe(II)/alpha-ketoglutarate-dependent arginine beta-hydroxylase